MAVSGNFSDHIPGQFWHSSGLSRKSQNSVWTFIILVYALSFLDLAGWGFNITLFKSIMAQWIPMKIITSLCFIFAATALVVIQINLRALLRKILPGVLAIVIFMVGFITIYVYLYSITTGHESPLTLVPFFGSFLHHLTRMAFLTSCSFLLIGIALFLLAADNAKASGIAHIIMLPVTIASYFVPVSYIMGAYSVHAFKEIPVALNTGIAFCGICCAIILMRPDTVLVKVFTSDNLGGIIARRLLPPLMILPVIIGWLRIRGERAGFFESDTGVVLVAITYTVCFLILVWLTSISVNKIDRKRHKSEEALRKSKERLELLSEITGQLMVSDDPGRLVNDICNRVMNFLDCHVFFNFLVDDTAVILRLNAYAGISVSSAQKFELTELGTTVFGFVALDVIPTIAENNRDTSDPLIDLSKSYGVKAYACYPILSRDKVIGTLSFGTRSRISFSEDDLSLIKTITDQISIALNRVIREQALHESEARIQKAQAIAHLGSWELDIVKNRLSWSDEVYRIFGLKPQEFEATYEAFLDAIHADDREAVDAAYSGSLREGKDTYEIEHRVVRKSSGEIRFVHEKCTHFRDASGKLIRSVGMVHDITERKTSELVLRESEEKYRLLFNGMMEGFAFHEIILDENGKPCDYRFLSINPAFESLTGLKAENVIGKKVKEVLPATEDFWIDTYGKVALTGESIDFEKYFPELNSYFKVSAFSPKNGYFAVIFENITNRVLAERELQSTKNYLENLINYANAPIVVWNPKTEILLFNKAFERLTGYSSSEVLGKKLDLLFPGESIKDSKEKIKQAIFDNWESIEIPILCKNKELKTVLWNSANIFDIDNETLISTIAQGQDITERKRAEELLIISRQEWIETFDLIPDLIAIIDKDYRIVKANKAMLNCINLSANDATGMHCFECIHGDNKSHPSCPHAMLLKDGKQHISEVYEKRLGGDFLVSVTPILDVKGNIEGSVHVAHDITERKKAEKELRESREKLNLALDNGSIGIWEWDTKTNVIEWDERMENIFGIEPGTFEGTYNAFEKFLVDEDLAHTRKAISRALEFDVPFETVYRIQLKNGEIKYISTKALVNRDSEGKPQRMVGVCFDITEMKKGVEQTLFSLNEDLLRSNKELEQFAYVASHDLQEPLRMISSFTQLLSVRYQDKLDKEANEFIKFAVDGALRMQRLINDLLQYSRIGTKGKALSVTDMHNIIGQTINNLSIIIKEKGALVTNDELPNILADGGQMVQLLQNLLGNALKFCNTEPRIHISATEDTDHYLFSVKDNGIGIEPQYFDRIFQIFQRLHAKDEYGGTGIGLAICRRIVERHGGKIWVESKPGEGTIVRFTIKK